MSAALDRVLDRLCCPHCGGALAREGAVLACARGHRHDIARDGHVTLLPPGGPRHRGDSATMVAARAAFLAAGHYAPLSEAIAAAAIAGARPAAGCAVDLGAGTGEHLAAVLGALPGWDGIALDASTAALRRVRHAHPRIAAVGCDAWRRLPMRDGAADVILNVFAPRDGGELARILAPGGALIAVTPAEHHLAELRPLLGTLQVGAGKQERLRAALPGLAPDARRELEFELALGGRDLLALVAMGPSAHHVAPEELQRRVGGAPAPVRATVAVVIETFSARPAASPSG